LESIREAIGRGEKSWMWILISLILSSNGKMEEALSSTFIASQFINLKTQHPLHIHSNIL